MGGATSTSVIALQTTRFAHRDVAGMPLAPVHRVATTVATRSATVLVDIVMAGVAATRLRKEVCTIVV